MTQDYAFRCASCHHHFELALPSSASGSVRACRVCCAEARRVLGVFQARRPGVSSEAIKRAELSEAGEGQFQHEWRGHRPLPFADYSPKPVNPHSARVGFEILPGASVTLDNCYGFGEGTGMRVHEGGHATITNTLMDGWHTPLDNSGRVAVEDSSL